MKKNGRIQIDVDGRKAVLKDNILLSKRGSKLNCDSNGLPKILNVMRSTDFMKSGSLLLGN